MGLLNIYHEIEHQLYTIMDDDGITPVFKHFHTWNNQLHDLQNGSDISIDFPAVLMEIVVDQNIKQLGNGNQIFDPLIIRLHIIHQYLNAEGAFWGEYEQNWHVFEDADKLFKGMQKFKVTNGSELCRIGQYQDFDHNNLYHFIQEYKCTYVDNLLDEPVNRAASVPPIDLETPITIQ